MILKQMATVFSGRMDTLSVLLLFAAGFTGGLAYLGHPPSEPSPIGLESYALGAAVPVALGQGFFQPDIENVRPLKEFFDGGDAALETDALPIPLPRKPSDQTQSSEFHFYLNHAVALIWRYTGICKDGLAPLIALFLGWTTVAVYGLMRLGMGKRLSALLALIFTFSPPVLSMLPFLRDFSKAPFLLTIFLCLGILIRKRCSFPSLLRWSLFLGFFHGFSLGFRQDVLIFLPLVVIILAVAGVRLPSVASETTARPLRTCIFRSTGAVIVYLLGFIALASPMLGKMEGGADPFHPLVQGFSIKHMQNLGLEPAAYVPLASSHDNYAFATYYHYYRLANNAPHAHFDYDTHGSQEAGRQWLIDIGTRFPADLLARIYASVFRIIRYADAFTPPLHRLERDTILGTITSAHENLAFHLHRYGVLYAATAMLLIACQSLTAALFLLLLLLYLCGYAGLQSELRHTFHLAFVPLWIIGFLLSEVSAALRVLLIRSRCPGRDQFLYALFRGSAFLFCAFLVLSFPLFALRLYQEQFLSKTLRPSIEAPRIPREYTTRQAFNWTLFDIHPEPTLQRGSHSDIKALYSSLSLLFQIKYPRLLPPKYMVLEFEGNHLPGNLLVRYGSDYPWGNFTQMMRLSSLKNPSGSVFYGFPVYEMVAFGERIRRSRFEGIAIPSSFAPYLKAIYEAQGLDSLRFLMPLTWSSNDDFSRPLFTNRKSQLPLYQRISSHPDPVYYAFVEHQPSAFYRAAEKASQLGRHREAALLYSLCLLFTTEADYRQHLAESLLREGAADLAYLAVKEESTLPDNILPARVDLLSRLTQAYVTEYTATLAPTSLEMARLTLDSLLALGPESAAEPVIQMLHPLTPELDRNSWRNAFRDIMILFPDYEGAMFLAYRSLGNRYDADANVQFWAEVANARPDSCLPWCRLTAALQRVGDHDRAGTVYATALCNCPATVDFSQHLFLPPPAYLVGKPK